MRKTRAEAFSDGVFAVAATVLVFNLVDPKVGSRLGQALLAEWPSYAAYAISFSTIVVIWVNHHAVTDAIERFDRRLLFINGLLLLTVAAVPFPTGLLAHYLQAGHDQAAASVAYGMTMTSMSIAFSVFNLYARRFKPTFVPLDSGRLFHGPSTVAPGNFGVIRECGHRARALRVHRLVLRRAPHHSRGPPQDYALSWGSPSPRRA